MMVLYRIEAGKVFPLHNHPHAQFGVFVEGGGSFKVGDEAWDVKAGGSYFIPPGTMHELKTTRDSLIIDFFTPEREDYVAEAQSPEEK
jgi:unsaturated pyranuronate lyase